MAINTQSVLFLLIGTILSGCLAVDSEQGQWQNWNVESIEVPAWEIGQWWRYDGSNGISYLYQVKSIEEKHGLETYRVHVELSRADELGAEEYINWFDTKTLALVAESKGGLYFTTECSAAGVFPIRAMKDSCYQTAGRGGNPDFEHHYNASKVLLGWQNLTLPAGMMQAYAIELHLESEDEGERDFPIWYGPETGLIVQAEWANGVTVRLADWGEADSPAL